MGSFRRFKILGLAAAALGLGLLGSNVARAADAALYEAAKKEGTVTWYTALIVNQTARPFADAFEKKYPGVKVNMVSGQATDLLLKLTNEGQANAMQADVYHTNYSDIAQLLKNNLLDKYDPPDAEQSLVDPSQFYTAFSVSYLVAAVNTDMVKPADVPKTMQDLLDPKWKGKIAWPGTDLPTGPPGFIGTTLATMGQDAGMDYLKKLATQKIINVAGNQRVVLDQLIAGEFPLALMTYNHLAQDSISKGAPIQWLKIEPAVSQVSSAFLMKGAPHPNAAKLFLNYMLSVEGQTVLSNNGLLVANPAVKIKYPELRPSGGNFKAYDIPVSDYTDKLPGWVKIYKDLFR